MIEEQIKDRKYKFPNHDYVADWNMRKRLTELSKNQFVYAYEHENMLDYIKNISNVYVLGAY